MKIGAQIEGDSLDLEVFLKERPRVNNWDFEGISKGKKKDLLEKLKLKRGSELSDYIIDKNKKLIKAYWSEKAFRNTEVDVRITDYKNRNDEIGELAAAFNAWQTPWPRPSRSAASSWPTSPTS